MNQGYEFCCPASTRPDKLLANVRILSLGALNNVQFADAEWQRFVTDWLDKPSEGIVDETRKVHDDYLLGVFPGTGSVSRFFGNGNLGCRAYKGWPSPNTRYPAEARCAGFF